MICSPCAGWSYNAGGSYAPHAVPARMPRAMIENATSTHTAATQPRNSGGSVRDHHSRAVICNCGFSLIYSMYYSRGTRPKHESKRDLLLSV